MNQKMADFFNLTFGFRKLIAWLAVFLVAVVFRLKNLVDGNQFTDLVRATFLGFVAGNSTEHIVTTIRQYIGKGQSVSTQPSPVPQGDDLVEPESGEKDGK